MFFKPRSTDGVVVVFRVGAWPGQPQVKGRRGVEEAVWWGVNNSLCIAEEKLRARPALELA